MVLAREEDKDDGRTDDLAPTVAEAIAIERDNAFPLTDFYTPPAGDFSPGELVRCEPLAGHTLPDDIRALRILYRSDNQHDALVFASGFVLMPDGVAPEAGWPVIAWAHGTSGVARQCAPSAMKNLYYGSVLADMVRGGFAVVASDYQGLGTAGRHRYMDKQAQAHDVIHSVRAARAAAPQLGAAWVVSGHSQGGLAAWAVAEMQADIKDPTYRGAVAVAPACHLPRLLGRPEEARGAGYYFAWHAYAIKQRFPAFDPASMLSDLGMRHYEQVTGEGCWLYGFATYAGIDDIAMLQPDWNLDPWVRRFYEDCSVGHGGAAGPILVIAGEGDNAVPLAGIEETVARARANGQDVGFVAYPGLDHDPVMMDTIGDQLDWIRARIENR